LAADIGALANAQTATRLREQESTIEFHMCDLIPTNPAPPRALASLLGCTNIHATINCGLVGEANDQTIAIWPHGITPTKTDIDTAFLNARADAQLAAFATRFDDTASNHHKHVSLWRYHPESAQSASLRSIVFANSAGDILTINPGTQKNPAVWITISQDESDHENAMSRFGFTHTLVQDIAR
jgi:hypothetical protein